MPLHSVSTGTTNLTLANVHRDINVQDKKLTYAKKKATIIRHNVNKESFLNS